MNRLTSDSGPSSGRVFVAGASGAVGQIIVAKLVAAGYDVSAMTRSPQKVDRLNDLGARPVVCDVFDEEELRRSVLEARPDVVVNQLTELPKQGLNPRKLGTYYARNDRVRREGTDNLLSAAAAAGARRYVGQSIAFWYEPGGDPVKGEGAPLWISAPPPIGTAVKALLHSEEAALRATDIEAVILRYGTFYGPGTWYSPDGDIGRQMRKRQYPKIGSGGGYTSFLHVDDAAEACVAFVQGGRSGIYNIVDDEPAPASEWMPVFAEAIGAKPPRSVPRWLAKLIAGEGVVEWTTRSPGASNLKVRRALGWQASYPSWRLGFTQGLQ